MIVTGYKELVDYINEESYDQGITQADVMRKINKSRSAVSTWFCGKREMSLQTAIDILAVLGKVLVVDDAGTV